MPKPPSNDSLHSPKYIASLALGAAAILVVGFLLRPRKPVADTPPAPSHIEMQRLTRLAQRQALDTMTEHFSVVARDLAHRVVQVGVGAGTGILWDPGLVVTSGQSAPESTVAMTSAGHLLTASRVVAGPQLPLAAYTLPGESLLPADHVREAGALSAAEWVLAIWHDGEKLAFAPGHYLESRGVTCDELELEEAATSVALSAEMAGGGFFDLDGGLAAVILPCGGDYVALRPDSVSELLVRGRSPEAQLLAQFGMRTLPLDDVARDYLGLAEGALVSEVWMDQPAGLSGLRPGDVIVGLGEQEVGSPGDLQPLLLPEELGTRMARVRRGRRTLEVDLAAGALVPSPPVDGEDHGVRLEPAPVGFTIDSVSTGSCGANAGLRAGDRIVRVGNTEPRNATEVRRALDRRPVFVEVERGRRRLGKLLQ